MQRTKCSIMMAMNSKPNSALPFAMDYRECSRIIVQSLMLENQKQMFPPLKVPFSSTLWNTHIRSFLPFLSFFHRHLHLDNVSDYLLNSLNVGSNSCEKVRVTNNIIKSEKNDTLLILKKL